MRALFTLLLLGGLVTSPPAFAQEPGYTSADAEMLESCLADSARDSETGATDGRADRCIGIVAEACQAEGPENQSTIGMSDCIMRETAWWDAVLNASYSSLSDRLQPETFEALRAAQRNWIAFSDSDCSFQYTHWQEGTIRTILGATCRLEHTADRAIVLRDYLGWNRM